MEIGDRQVKKTDDSWERVYRVIFDELFTHIPVTNQDISEVSIHLTDRILHQIGIQSTMDLR